MAKRNLRTKVEGQKSKDHVQGINTNNSVDVKRGSEVDRFASEVRKAQLDGYVTMPAPHGLSSHGNGGIPFEETLNLALADMNGQDMWAGPVKPPTGYCPSPLGTEIAVPDGIGTPKLGFISWGRSNRLPNQIAALTSILPYTATAAKFNVDVAAGMGFVPKYCYHQMSNGALVAKEIDFKDAGVLLEQQLLDARKELLAFRASLTSGSASDGSAVGESTAQRNNDKEEAAAKRSVPNRGREDGEAVVLDEGASLEEQIERTYVERVERIKAQYERWKKDSVEVEEFLHRNNLALLALNLANDMVLFNICFPEIELSRNTTDQPNNALWKPRATGITYRGAHTCRLEKMDDNGRINYVYHSNRWLDQQNGLVADAEIIAFPSLDPEHPSFSLSEAVRNFKTANPTSKPQKRPTRFILPSYYPSAGRPYYPQPSWYSVFGGDIYSYLSVIVSDRATRRKNKNIIGHIIYVHQDYINRLMLQRQQELAQKDPKRAGQNLTQEENKQLIDQMWQTINTFLANRDNAGQPLLSYSFTGTDGKEHDAYRIVDVPNTTADDAQADKTELEEISAIVFFALQCHPELIGAVPGRTGAGGGTYQRELFLLKQCQMAPTQQILLKALDTIAQFNEWKNLKWVVRQQVLTTLDNSKTGLKEAE